MYSTLSLQSRLKNFQNLLSCSDGKFPDAFLFVAGLDGRGNKGSVRALKYLLEGSFGEELFNGILADECLEEMILLVCESELSVFWGGEAREKFSKALHFACPSIREYSTSTSEDNDIDLFQLRKCESFKAIVLSALPQGSKIGIPVPIGYDDVLDIESWPLLQSFALDHVLCPTGFFTARYSIVDITNHIETIFRSIDPVSVDGCLAAARSIVMHTEQMLNGLNHRSNYPRAQLTADEILTPLDSLYEFGELSSVFPVDPVLKPVVLIGASTNLLSDCANFHDEMVSSRWREEVVGADNLHILMEACDPKSGLRWCRTYFLHYGGNIPLVTVQGGEADDGEEGDELSDENTPVADDLHGDLSKGSSRWDRYLWRLQQLYIKLWHALRVAVSNAFQSHVDVLEAGDEIQVCYDRFLYSYLYYQS